MRYVLPVLLFFVIYRLLSFARFHWKNSNKFAAIGAILLSIAAFIVTFSFLFFTNYEN